VTIEEVNMEVAYSEHYHDYTWRKQQAAIGWRYVFPRHEYVGHVKIYYTDEEFSLDSAPSSVITLYQTKKL
jgi:hypothetical protein